jgi:hypothetical protein
LLFLPSFIKPKQNAMAKKELIQITSYTYVKGDKKFKAKLVKPKRGGLSFATEGNCQSGEVKCENGKIHRCMPIDNEGTCIWFITNEDC